MSLSHSPKSLVSCKNFSIDNLRIAVDLSTLLPGGENGGVKPFTIETIKSIQQIEGDKISFIFLTWSKSHKEIQVIKRHNDEIICVRDDPDNIETAAIQSIKVFGDIDLLLHLDVDVLYSPLSSSEFTCPSIPTITTIVDILHRDYPNSLTSNQISDREINFKNILHSSDLFQCISNYTATQLKFHYKVQSERIFVSYISIQKRLLNRNISRYKITTKPYFLYPANAWVHKNHQTLLVAYRLYKTIIGDKAWDLALTGHEDSAMNKLKDLTRVLGLSTSVHFCGHLNLRDYTPAWLGAEGLIFPSLHEGFGIPILEAMQFRVPIISNDAGALKEIAKDAAIFVDCTKPKALAEAMRLITEEKETRYEYINRGAERLKCFNLITESKLLVEKFKLAKNLKSIFWHKGIASDGWTQFKAIISLPNTNDILTIKIVTNAIPQNRRIRIYNGTIPWGGYYLPKLQTNNIIIKMQYYGKPLVLEIPDAKQMSKEDPRYLGINIKTVTIKDSVNNHFELI